MNVRILGLGTDVSALCVSVFQFAEHHLPHAHSIVDRSDSFTYSKYSGNLQAGHTSNFLSSYFWVSNCSKCIYGSIPVSYDLKEMRGNCKLKEALDHTVWRTPFGIGY